MGGRVGAAAAMRRTCWQLAVVLGALLWMAIAQSQAWLPEKGSFDCSLSFNNTFNKHHYRPDGEEFDIGHTRAKTIGLVMTYAPSDRVAFTAGIPYVSTQYHGPRPHPTELDDGDRHATLTDLRLELHYQAREAPVALAPYVAVVIPTHDYETLAHAAPGRALEELWLGVFAGKSLDPWIPRTYVQVRYNYAFVEKVVGTAHDRSNVDLEIGHFVTPRWSVRALGFWQETYGGIEVPIPSTHPLFPYHDQLAAHGFLNVAAGTAVSLTERLGFYALVTTSVRGKNGHKLDEGLILGYTHRLFVP